MPLTAKGKKIRRKMKKTYGTMDKVNQVFYAMVKEGKLKGVEGRRKTKKSKKK